MHVMAKDYTPHIAYAVVPSPPYTHKHPQSVCYQLPALLTPQSVTLVVSPLLSLIHDQVGALRALGVRVEALTGVADKDEANRVLRALDNVDNPINLLYGTGMGTPHHAPRHHTSHTATPEKLVNARRLMAKLEKLYKVLPALACIVNGNMPPPLRLVD